jgi:hypothetical protein
MCGAIDLPRRRRTRTRTRRTSGDGTAARVRAEVATTHGAFAMPHRPSRGGGMVPLGFFTWELLYYSIAWLHKAQSCLRFRRLC